MTSGRVRIIVLNHDRPDLTLVCVQSALQQTYPDFSLVVVDNGSTMTNYQDLVNYLPRGVTVLRSERNLGYACGNNLGARFEEENPPDYLLFANNDVVFVDPQTCQRLVDALQGNTRRVACSPLVNTLSTNLPPNCQIQVRRVPNYLTVLIASSWWLRRISGLRRLAAKYVYEDLRPFSPNREIEVESINGSCFLITRQFLQSIGYLDEGTFLYQEELILGQQIMERGNIACLVTSTCVSHEQGSTSGQRSGSLRLRPSIEMVRSEVYYCRKYLGTSNGHILLLVAVRVVDFLSKLVLSGLGRILH